MKTVLKKAVAVLLTVVMLISVVSNTALAASAQTAGAASYPTLVLDEEQTATISERGERTYFSFTPAEDSVYVFESFADGGLDTIAYLYNADMERITEADQGGQGNNFRLRYSLTAGVTYIFGAGFYYDETGTFPVKVTKYVCPFDTLTIEPLTLIENTNGELSSGWNGEEEVEYYRYNWWNYLSYTVTLKNGDEIKGTGSGFNYNDNWYHLDYEDVQYADHQWTVGGTYTATASVEGISADLEISIIDSPFAGITVDPISMTENKGGSDDCGWNGEEDVDYYRYYWWNKLSYTIALKAGGSIQGIGTSFTYQGTTVEVTYHAEQDAQKPWTVGNTYTGTVSVADVSAPVNISINPLVIPTLALGEQTTVTTNSNESMLLQFTPAESGIYRLESFAETEVTGQDPHCHLYDADMNELAYDDDGSNNGWNFLVQEQLTAGETYYFDVKDRRDPSTFSICLTKFVSPIQSIVVAPLRYMEHTGGSWAEYNDEEPGEPQEYYCYDWWNDISYTVTMKNGDVIRASGSFFVYEDEWYHLSWDDNQNSANPWTVGNTYTSRISVLGASAEVSISITEFVAPTLALDGQVRAQCTDGQQAYFKFTPVESGWYAFRSLISEAYPIGYLYDARMRRLASDSYGGSNENFRILYHFTAGETYYFGVASNYSETTTIPVCVSRFENPFTSIEVKDFSIIENTHGYTCDHGDNSHYYYDWEESFSYTVTLKNGATITDVGTSFRYQGESYYFDHNISQSCMEPWEVGERTYTVSLLGLSDDCTVSIEASPVTSITAEPITIPTETGGYWETYWDEEAQDWLRDYYRYNWQDMISYTVTLADGTTFKNASTIQYGGTTYSLRGSADQSSENRWLPGNVYTGTISILGASVEVEIYIQNENYDENSALEYLVQNNCAIISGTMGEGDVLTIPRTIGEYPVTAIFSLAGGNYKEIVLPDSVVSISASMLQSCSTLQKITFGTGVAYLTNSMFEYADSLTEIVVAEENETYTSVDGIVYDKQVTKMVAIPNAKTTTHAVPATVTNIERYIDGSYLFDITVSNTNTGYAIEDGIVYNADKTEVYSCNPSKQGSYIMPDSVTTISRCAFMYSNLSEITISNNVSDLVYYSFAGSVNLEKVVLPDNLTTISRSAFEGCKKLTDVKLPSKLEILDAWAFGKSGVKQIDIPSGVKTIGYSAFEKSNLEKVTFAEGLVTIGSSAFSETKLKNAKLPNSLRTIGDSAFYGTPMQTVDLGSGVTIIHDYAFFGTKLTALTLPESVRSIGESAFYGIEATTLDLPESVTDITYRCFENSKNLKNIDLPDQLQHIDGYAFHGTAWYNSQKNGVVYLENSLYHYKGDVAASTNITVKRGTKLIADYAFGDQVNLKKITIPKSIQNIGFRAFANCENLTDVYYEGTAADRANILVGEVNETLESATWHYNICIHDWKAATCTAPKTCKLCNAKEGSVAGHKWVNATCKAPKTCSVCKKTSGSVADHKWAKATCTKPKTCSVCKKTSGKSLGHDYDSTTKKATTSKHGEICDQCTRCDKKKNVTTIYKIKSVKLSTTSYTYNGKKKTPTVTVKDYKNKTISSKYYTVSYSSSSRKSVGQYTVTVKFKSKYSGTVKLTFKINPKGTSVSSVTAAKKSLKVKIKKQSSQTTGYEIQYSTSKKFTSPKSKTTTKTSYTIKSLKAKKTYYVRVRTYKTVSGKKYYSGWSSVKSKKTK